MVLVARLTTDLQGTPQIYPEDSFEILEPSANFPARGFNFLRGGPEILTPLLTVSAMK